MIQIVVECSIGVVGSLVDDMVTGKDVISELRKAVLVVYTVDRRHAISSVVVYIAKVFGVGLRLLLVSLREL